MGTLISVHEAYLEEITSLQHYSLRVEDVALDACGFYVSVKRISMSTIVPDCQYASCHRSSLPTSLRSGSACKVAHMALENPIDKI